MKIAITAIHVVVCIILIAVVMLQSGKNEGLSGAFGGSASSDTYLAKNKAKTFDAKLAKGTKWIALAFIILTLALSII